MGNVVFFFFMLTAGCLSLVLSIPDGTQEEKDQSHPNFAGGIGLILLVICAGFFFGAKFIVGYDWSLSRH